MAGATPLYRPNFVRDEGLDCGLCWDHRWVPGGPYVPAALDSRNSGQVVRQKTAEVDRDDWLGGWLMGAMIKGAMV